MNTLKLFGDMVGVAADVFSNVKIGNQTAHWANFSGGTLTRFIGLVSATNQEDIPRVWERETGLWLGWSGFVLTSAANLINTLSPDESLGSGWYGLKTTLAVSGSVANFLSMHFANKAEQIGKTLCDDFLKFMADNHLGKGWDVTIYMGTDNFTATLPCEAPQFKKISVALRKYEVAGVSIENNPSGGLTIRGLNQSRFEEFKQVILNPNDSANLEFDAVRKHKV